MSELPSKCPYCNETLLNDYYCFKYSNAVSQTCDKKLSHKLTIYSENSSHITRLNIVIFSNKREIENHFTWNFKQKIFHINNDLMEWVLPSLNYPEFYLFFERIKKLKILL